MRFTFNKKWLLFAGVILFGIGPGLADAEIPKDVLIIGQPQENFLTLDPGICFEAPTSGFVKNLYTALVTLDVKNGKFVIEPGAAEKWEVAADGKTWTFHLRKNIVFDNGDPLKAADVVYSLQRSIKLKKSPAWLFTDVLGMTEQNITAPDENTVQIVTNGAPPNAVLTNIGNTLGGILNSKVVKEHEVNGDMGAAWLIDHSAGAGPYSLKEWKRKEVVVFVANKKYWKGEPKIKTIIFKDVPEAADRFLQIQKGDIDIAFNLIPEQANELKTKPNLQIITTPGQSNEYVGVNAGWGPFKDVRVRQAVKYAIDYDSIINKVRGGYAIPNQQFNAVGYFGYKEKNPFKLNLKKAKALMNEAGYANGFDVELITNTTEIRRNEATLIQENLAQIGIKANINVMQAAQMYQKMREQGINLIVAGWGIDYPDADALAKPFANYRAKQLAWRMAWLDDKAADMTEAAGKEMNEKKRAKLYADLTEYWQQNGPFAMLYQPVEFWAVSNEVKGLPEAFAGFSMHIDFTKVSK
ncbi:MAG: ABC transporter substrate-binding protein [Desulfobacteraceae bacterium]|nr:MAG: ABC transporter substrate-binding protein [Desulfobacteraceae bacterium]